MQKSSTKFTQDKVFEMVSNVTKHNLRLALLQSNVWHFFVVFQFLGLQIFRHLLGVGGATEAQVLGGGVWSVLASGDTAAKSDCTLKKR